MAVVCLLLAFVVAGSGFYRYLSSRDQRPFLKSAATDLAGSWQNKTASLKVEAVGPGLKVNGVEFVRDGQAPRWVEKAPQTTVPRVLEFDGASLKMTSVSDSNQLSEVVFVRAR
ncbi:MAG: hypothetical protein U0931_27305 [Vulcanimicrobiota bacterium]